MTVTDRLLRILLLLACVIPAPLYAADELKRIDALVAGGATQLAMQVLEANQPGMENLESWVQWEQRRFKILVALDDLDGIIKRIAALPTEFPAQHRRALLDEAAAVALDHGKGAVARGYLTRLLIEFADDQAAVAGWRERVVRSYLAEDRVDDASIAMERYRQEFKPRDRDWSYLYARVLLRAEKYDAASKLMATQRTFDGRLLQLVADLRHDRSALQRVIRDGRQLAVDTRKHAELNPLVWALLAEAAAASGDRSLRVQALEHAVPVKDKLFRLSADDLWEAYLAVADELGNEAHLLVGDDEAWYKLAGRFEKNAPFKSRSVLAMVAQRGLTPEARDRAHYRLLSSLNDARLVETGQRLYTASSRYAGYGDLPPVVRYYLSDKAFNAYNIKLAAELVEGLDQPPPGQSEAEWALRRARLSIYAGDYHRGIELAGNQIESAPSLDDEAADRVLQIPFDLQAAGRHEDAYRLYEVIHNRVESKKLKRETLFWMGDAAAAQGRQTDAAELYLRSAIFQQPDGSDIWGQTARFNAAQSLSRANLIKDAERVYRDLLRITDDPKRRVVIERNLKQLWLLGPKLTTQ